MGEHGGKYTATGNGKQAQKAAGAALTAKQTPPAQRRSAREMGKGWAKGTWAKETFRILSVGIPECPLSALSPLRPLALTRLGPVVAP